MSGPSASGAIDQGCWDGYSSQLYVQRKDLEREMQSSLTGSKGERTPILSLVGPPGVGKSWLLAHMREEWERKHAFVLALEAWQLMNPSEHEPIKQELVHQANAHCQGLNYSTALLPSLENLIADLSGRLTKRCCKQQFFVLIDGCDDLPSEEVFDKLQEIYLQPFFAHGTGCFRMVITRRLRLHDPILKPLQSQLLVGTLQPGEAHGQRKNLLDAPAEEPRLPDGCPYQWNHPYINCYLLTHSKSGAEITPDTLDTCCRSLVERSRLASSPSSRSVEVELEELRLLTKTHQDGWTSDDFRHTMRRDFDDSYQRRGLVRVSKPRLRYRVVDGLHELLCALPTKELRS